MTLWELRQFIEQSIPVWSLVVLLVLSLALMFKFR